MPPIATGDLITAVQFNELVTSYNKLWGDEAISANFADITTNFVEHSHGWGQASAEPTVDPDTIIESGHTNRLLGQMNAGLYHYEQTSALIPHFSTTVIDASYIISTIEDEITRMSLVTNRFKANDVDANRTDKQIGDSDIATPTWTDTISSIGMAKFANYDEARYFFNSGGKLSVDLDQGLPDTGGASWDILFGTTGLINISAVATSNEGTNSIVSAKGFYDINPNGVYTEVFMVLGYVASGDYAYSAYSNRSIKISLKADEVGGTFNVYIKVTLTDDVTSGTMSSELTCDYGYVNQHTTPVLSGGSSDAPYTAVDSEGTHVYQFITRQIPTITVDTSWTL
jgi:hypothetical protein